MSDKADYHSYEFRAPSYQESTRASTEGDTACEDEYSELYKIIRKKEDRIQQLMEVIDQLEAENDAPFDDGLLPAKNHTSPEARRLGYKKKMSTFHSVEKSQGIPPSIAERMDSLERELDEAVAENITLQSENNSLREQEEELRSLLTEELAVLDQKELECEFLRQQNEKLRPEVVHKDGAITALTKQVNMLEEEVQRMESCISMSKGSDSSRSTLASSRDGSFVEERTMWESKVSELQNIVEAQAESLRKSDANAQSLWHKFLRFTESQQPNDDLRDTLQDAPQEIRPSRKKLMRSMTIAGDKLSTRDRSRAFDSVKTVSSGKSAAPDTTPTSILKKKAFASSKTKSAVIVNPPRSSDADSPRVQECPSTGEIRAKLRASRRSILQHCVMNEEWDSAVESAAEGPGQEMAKMREVGDLGRKSMATGDGEAREHARQSQLAKLQERSQMAKTRQSIRLPEDSPGRKSVVTRKSQVPPIDLQRVTVSTAPVDIAENAAEPESGEAQGQRRVKIKLRVDAVCRMCKKNLNGAYRPTVHPARMK